MKCGGLQTFTVKMDVECHLTEETVTCKEADRYGLQTVGLSPYPFLGSETQLLERSLTVFHSGDVHSRSSAGLVIGHLGVWVRDRSTKVVLGQTASLSTLPSRTL